MIWTDLDLDILYIKIKKSSDNSMENDKNGEVKDRKHFHIRQERDKSALAENT